MIRGEWAERCPKWCFVAQLKKFSICPFLCEGFIALKHLGSGCLQEQLSWQALLHSQSLLGLPNFGFAFRGLSLHSCASLQHKALEEQQHALSILAISCSAHLQGYLECPQPLLLYQGSGPRVNNSPSFLARRQNCWNRTPFHISGPDCLTASEKGKQLSARNLKELFLNSWKKFIFQTWKSNMKNVYFPNIVDRKRKQFHITVISQGFLW